MKVVYNDGGRAASGRKGSAGDCVVRAVAIATEQDYGAVYARLASGMGEERRTKRSGRAAGRRTAREGVNVQRKWFKDYMQQLGWRWVPTMGIGTGCRVHLSDGELPMGRLIVSLSKHYTAVIDGVIHDTHNPQRQPQNVYGGTPVRCADGQLRNPIIARIGGRCVYGYWCKA